MDLLRCAGVKSREVAVYNTESEDESNCNDRPLLQNGVSAAGSGGGVVVLPSIPEVNGDLVGMPSFSLIIRRGSTGFGFTVFGSSPVQVGRVEPGSPAAESGLLTDDYIVRINGQNVSRSTAESVARIVRDSVRQIILEIQRTVPHSAEHCPSCPPVWTPSGHQMIADPWSLLPCPGATAAASGLVEDSSHARQGRARTPPATFSAISAGRQPFASIGNLQQQQQQQQQQLQRQQRRLVRPLDGTASDTGAITMETGNASDCISGKLLHQQRRLIDARLSGDVIMTSTPHQGALNTNESQTNGRISPTPSSVSRCDSCRQCGQKSDTESLRSVNVSNDPFVRQMAVHKLSLCDVDFATRMKLGLRCYLHPLQQPDSPIPAAEHAALFLNLEKIQRLSEERACRWQENGSETSSFDYISSIYLPQIESFFNAYEAYCGGVRNSIRLLVELKKLPEFDKFLKNVECNQMSLSTFLKKPIEHIKDLVLGLQKVLNHTPSSHPDYSSLRQVVQTIRQCCNRINENNLYASTMSLASTSRDTLIHTSSSRWSASTSGSSSTSSTASDRSRSSAIPPSIVAPSAAASSVLSGGSGGSSVISSIDSELLDIQTRLVFPKHIPIFHLATAAHHLIYSGELCTFVANGTRNESPIRLYVVLMSDLLLLTRPDHSTGSLEVFDQPIGLQDIVGSNFLCNHPCEFALSIETRVTNLQETWEPHLLTLRAPSVELKCTWKNILEQRILTCKAQRQQVVASRTVDNIV